MRGRRVLLLLGAVTLCGGGLAQAQPATAPEEPDLREPLQIRDEHVLAQGRLTLPPTSADPVAPGVTRVRLSFLWANSFSWTQEVAGENPTDRSFLIDGETRTLDLTVTRGVAANADIALRVPVRWRGGGSLDGFIDAWHRRFDFLGIPDGDRPRFLKDAFRVKGLTTAGEPFAWTDATGTGLGNVELASRWRFHHEGASAALVARLSLPTASSPFESAWGGGVQVVARWPLGANLDLHAGAGGTVEGHRDVRGIAYEPARAHGHLALAYRPWRRLGLSVETDVASRLVSNIDRYPGLHWLINGGAKLAATRALVVELGLTENLASQLCTTDFALYVAISVRP